MPGGMGARLPAGMPTGIPNGMPAGMNTGMPGGMHGIPKMQVIQGMPGIPGMINYQNIPGLGLVQLAPNNSQLLFNGSNYIRVPVLSQQVHQPPQNMNMKIGN